MISFDQAFKKCLEVMPSMKVQRISFQESLGRVLAQNIIAKRDMPPFNKSAVDGYACFCPSVGGKLQLVGEVAAGDVSNYNLTSGQAVSIMTGAPVPKTANWVVMKEDVNLQNECVCLDAIGRKNNIANQGEDYQKGDVLIAKGEIVGAAEITIMAAEGYSDVLVSSLPEVNILSTGNELVEPFQTPLPHQIRNSNAYQLLSQFKLMGIHAKYAGIVGDSKEQLMSKIEECKSYDLSVLTGGVSMGDYDFVPEVIQQAGFEIVFHKIAIKPGKPTLLAKRGKSLILALPGNPVSAFLQFHILIKPMVLHACGSVHIIQEQKVMLGEDIKVKKSNRDVWLPVRLVDGEIFRIDYNGSGHVAALAYADAFLEIKKDQQLCKGEQVYVRPI